MSCSSQLKNSNQNENVSAGQAKPSQGDKDKKKSISQTKVKPMMTALRCQFIFPLSCSHLRILEWDSIAIANSTQLLLNLALITRLDYTFLYIIPLNYIHIPSQTRSFAVDKG